MSYNFLFFISCFLFFVSLPDLFSVSTFSFCLFSFSFLSFELLAQVAFSLFLFGRGICSFSKVFVNLIKVISFFFSEA